MSRLHRQTLRGVIRDGNSIPPIDSLSRSDWNGVTGHDTEFTIALLCKTGRGFWLNDASPDATLKAKQDCWSRQSRKHRQPMSNLYVWFNAAEGVFWILVGGFVWLRIPRQNSRQTRSVWIAAIAFVSFGVSDWIECRYERMIPLWLWGWKTLCGAALLVARYEWRGWSTFRVTDREFLFGLFCLASVFGLIVLQRAIGV